MPGHRGDAEGEGPCGAAGDPAAPGLGVLPPAPGSGPGAAPRAARAPGPQVSRPPPGLAPRGRRLPFRKGIAEGRSQRGRPCTPRPGDVRVPVPRLGDVCGCRVLGEGGGKGHIWAKAGASPAEGGTAAKREARPRGGPRGNRLTPALPASPRARSLPEVARPRRAPSGPASPDAGKPKGSALLGRKPALSDALGRFGDFIPGRIGGSLSHFNLFVLWHTRLSKWRLDLN